MRKKQPPYAPEFRRQMVELVRAGRTPEELAKEFEPSAQTIRNWVAQGDRDEGRRSDGLTTPEREELSRLRRENRQLKLEREILSKATVRSGDESTTTVRHALILIEHDGLAGAIMDHGLTDSGSTRVCARLKERGIPYSELQRL